MSGFKQYKDVVFDEAVVSCNNKICWGKEKQTGKFIIWGHGGSKFKEYKDVVFDAAAVISCNTQLCWGKEKQTGKFKIWGSDYNKQVRVPLSSLIVDEATSRTW